jgi:hypothetical protein
MHLTDKRNPTFLINFQNQIKFNLLVIFRQLGDQYFLQWLIKIILKIGSNDFYDLQPNKRNKLIIHHYILD